MNSPQTFLFLLYYFYTIKIEFILSNIQQCLNTLLLTFAELFIILKNYSTKYYNDIVAIFEVYNIMKIAVI